MPETKTDLTSAFLQDSINPLEWLKCFISRALLFASPILLAVAYGWKWVLQHIYVRQGNTLHLLKSSLIIFVNSTDIPFLFVPQRARVLFFFLSFFLFLVGVSDSGRQHYWKVTTQSPRLFFDTPLLFLWLNSMRMSCPHKTRSDNT